MGQVLIRNLDEALLADYRRVAKDKGRTLEAELRNALDRARPSGRVTGEALIALSRKMREQRSAGTSTIDGTAVIRAARDAGYSVAE